MPKAIVIQTYGGPEVLQLREVEPLIPKADELLLQQTAVGINFHDIYVRSGLYKSLSLPGIPGIEGIGKIVAMGDEVTGFSIGERVAYITSGYGGYAETCTIPASIAVPVPAELADTTVAAVILKGLTVQMLTRQVVEIHAGDKILVHAAAGGVGQLLVQAAKSMGAEVLGTVGAQSKVEAAKKAGCDHVILYKEERVLDRVLDITDGEGLHIVYDSVGKDTFHDSLASLTYEGHLVNFGQASGPIEGFEIPMLAKKSNTLSRPMVFHYTRNREKLLSMSQELFRSLIGEEIICQKPLELPLAEAAKSHELLASRTLTQPVVLIP